MAWFGENDCVPLTPTTLMTIAPSGGAGELLGPVGDELPWSPLATAPRVSAPIAIAKRNVRMISILSGISAVRRAAIR